MPKSKRQKIVHLTKATKGGRTAKEELVTQVRDACERYSSVYVFSVDHMRNAALKELRAAWATDSRFFYGKVKVMALAIGSTPETEVAPGLHALVAHLKGQVGLIFTNRARDDVIDAMKQFCVPDYARTGNVAYTTFRLPQGPLTRGPDADPFPHNMEPQLRKLGLPTQLKNGVVTLLRDCTVCTEGKPLNTEQAQLLKLFFLQQAEFRIHLRCVYNFGTGQVEDLSDVFPTNTATTTTTMEDAAADDDE